MRCKISNARIGSPAFVFLATGVHGFMPKDIIDDHLEGLGSMGYGPVGWSAREEFS